MSIENGGDKALPNISENVVGQEPVAIEQNLSGNNTKTGRKKRPRVEHAVSESESSDSSSSESSSDSDTGSKACEPLTKRKRFEASAEEAQFQWKLPKGMASYANKHLQKFVPEKDLRDSILTFSPVPSNIDGPKKLDEFFKELLDEKKKKTELFWDSSLEKIQQKTVNVFGPLSKVWMAIESANEAEGEKVEIPLEDISTSLEQSILLLGQAFNAVTYQRRCNVLSVLMNDHKKTKSTIKEHAQLFEATDNEELFGKKFRKHVKDTAKVKKESKEIYNKQRVERKQPFQKGPSFQRGNGGRTAFFSKFNNNSPKFGNAANSRRGRGFNANGKEKYEKTTLPQHGQPGRNIKRYTRNIALKRVTKCSPRGKKYVPWARNMELPPCRKTAILCKQLAGSDKQSRNFRTCIRVKNPIYGGTKTDSTPTSGENEQGTECLDRPGDPGHVEERGCSGGQLSERSISEQPVFSKKEGWGEQTSDKFKATECFYTLPTFQDGGSASFERNDAGERLYVQNRPKGCIFLPPTTPDTQEICPVSVERPNLRVSLPLFWPRPSTENIHQVIEGANSSASSSKHKDNYLFGRYVDNEPVCRRISGSTGNINLSPATFGVCDQSKEITFNTSSENRIFRDGNKFGNHDIDLTTGKGEQAVTTMSGGARKPKNLTLETFQSHRLPVLHSTSSIALPVATEVFTAPTDRFSREGTILSVHNNTRSGFSKGNQMVDKQPLLDEWEVNFSSPIKNCHPDRRIKEGLGGSLFGEVSRGAVVSEGVTPAHKSFRTESSTFSPTNLLKSPESNKCAYSNGQYDSSFIPCQNGGHSQQGIDVSSKGNLGFSSVKTDHDYCRVPARDLECRGGQGIKAFPGLKRVVALPPDISKNLSEMGSSGHGFVCLQSLSPGPSIHGMEARSGQPSHGCSPTEVVTSLPICISTILPCGEGGGQSKGRESFHDFDNPSMANTTMVRPTTGNVSAESASASSLSKSIKGSTGKHPSTCKEQLSNTSGVENFRKNLADTGISERAAGLITAARRPGSLSNYESSWGKWSSWCGKQQVSPFRCSVNFVLDFLAELYQLQYEYSTINCHRSAISAYHDPLDNVPVGQHPKVSALMTGIFNQRPPKPRYSFVWDVEQVLTYLGQLPGNDQLSDRLLTLKLTMLLALASACRCSELKCLDIRYMTKSTRSYIFQFSKVTKSWKKGKAPPSLEFYDFESNKSLCVVSALEAYLQRTAGWRSNNNHQLLLGTVKPHNEVAKSTISGWVKIVLRNAGIDTNIFKAHSSRSASTSKAKIGGCSLQDILKRGQWSGKSTWQKHYHKTVVNPAQVYQQSIFSASDTPL